MPSTKLKKSKPKKKPTTSLTPSANAAPVQDPPPAPEVVGVSSQQQPADTASELKKLEIELSQKKTQGPKLSDPGKQEPESEAPKKRRKFKRPPPENTIRMTIRQYWRFRVWIANKKLQLPPDLIGAVLEGTDQALVEPLVDPVIGIIDEYVPEQWIEFIEEKSPILTFLLALFEAEQTFAARIGDISKEIRVKETRDPQPAQQQQPAAYAGYPRKDQL